MTTRADRAPDGRGMVTAELAVTTLAAFTLLIIMCWGIFLVVMQLRCIDTAAAVARQTARGDRRVWHAPRATLLGEPRWRCCGAPGW